MNGEALANFAAQAADDKRANQIVILKMAGISVMADYFVICHGNSEKQVQAIARGIKDAANDQDIEIRRIEGFDKARWILIDMEDVIVHVFHKEERHYYQLEKLWGDAPLIEFESSTSPS